MKRLLFTLLMLGGATAVQADVDPSFTVRAMAPVVPIIREQSTNALFRVAVYLDKTVSQPIRVTGLSVFVQSGLADIDSVFVYKQDTEAVFDPKRRSTGVRPSGKDLLLPLDIPARAGITYIWIGVKLKPEVSLDGLVDLRPKELGLSNGWRKAVEQGSQGFAKRKASAIRRAGDDGVHTYRIPGIAITDRSTLIAVYDIRYKHSGDLPANVDVGMSRSTDGGKTWEPMRIIMDMGEPHDNNGVGDPAIVFDPVTRKLFVTALWSKGNRSIAGSGPGLSPDETGQLVIAESGDDGLTWSTPVSITPQVKDPAWKLFFQGPGNGTVMKNGTLVFAAQYWDAAHMPHATLIYSSDHGKTWKRGVAAKSNTTEAQVEETRPGVLMMSMRDNRGKFRSVATTTDMGQTWTEHRTSYSVLEDPICMAGFMKAPVRLESGVKEVMFFSNPSSSYARVNMSIRASKDLGETWPGSVLIDERSTFGYSVMVRIDENTIGLLYEGTRDLYFVRVPVKDFVK